MDKDNKREVTYEEKKTDDKVAKLKYSEMRGKILAIDGIRKLEEFDASAKRIMFFIDEDIAEINVIEAIEELPFVDMIKNYKKVEVR